jgi:outer membrane protein W
MSSFSLQVLGQYNGYNYTGGEFNPYLGRVSYSIGAGLSAYQGEISSFQTPRLQNFFLNPSMNLGLAYRIMDHFSVKGDLHAFTLSATSETENNSQAARTFSSFNFDYSLLGAIDLFGARRIDGRFYHWNIQPFGGIGQVMFFPNNNIPGGSDTGEIIRDSTAIQTSFKRHSLIFPVGIDFQYYIDKNHCLSLSGNYRFTQTDFLDAVKDLSHTNYDAYFTLQFKYTVIIDPTPGKSLRYEAYINKKKRKMAGK